MGSDKSKVLEAIFGGFKALLRGAEVGVSRLLRVVLSEIDRSAIGQVIVEVFRPSKDSVRRAQDIAEEEAELARKAQRDGEQTNRDREKQAELERAREEVRKEYEKAKAREIADELERNKENLVAAPADADEYAATIGYLTLKKNCPECGAPMNVNCGPHKGGGRRDFWWNCTSQRAHPWLPFDPAKEHDVSMLRLRDRDLDIPTEERRKRWTEPKTLDEAHNRLRKHIGESDVEMLCKYHLVATKLMPVLRPGGALLDSYQFLCMQTLNGKACPYSVALTTLAQISGVLRRLEGRGIL